MNRYKDNRGASAPMLASFLKRDLKILIQRDASPNFQDQNGLLSLRSWWRSVRSLKRNRHFGPDKVAVLHEWF